ncbi:MAG: hypothetical protein R6X10_17870 [Desulfobacterales bacterium]
MKIAPLTKVTLSVATGPGVLNTAEDSKPKLITFIYGIGLSGLTDFECALANQTDENEIRLCLKPDDHPHFFEHLSPLFEPFLKNQDEIDLRITLVASEPADSTEVVKAMASNQHCGCDCGCHSS